MIQPPSPKPQFTPSSPYWIRVAQVYNALWALTAHNPFVIAALANADMESSLLTNVKGDGGRAYNLWQWWWEPRGARILQNTGIDVRTETRTTRVCGALWWELNNVEPYKDALRQMLDCTTYEAATPIFCKVIEGAGAKDAAQRRVTDASIFGPWIERNGIFISQHPAS